MYQGKKLKELVPISSLVAKNWPCLVRKYWTYRFIYIVFASQVSPLRKISLGATIYELKVILARLVTP